MDIWLSLWERMLLTDGRVTLFALGGVAVITLLERVMPAEPGQGFQGRARNLIFLLQYKFLGIGGIAAFYVWGPSPSLFTALPSFQLGPGPLTNAALVAANLVLIDLLYYFYHRAQHRIPFLWAIHELHHADRELNATSSYRTYWLEAPVQTILVITPTLILFGGLGPTHSYTVLACALFFLIFSHSNLRLSLGPLTPWVIGPQVHRVHHSRLPGHRDQNFAQDFPFIDRLFGTYYAPARDEFPPTGVDELATDATLVTVFIRPFKIWLGRAGER